jgi:Protein of unknown function (DUF2550)
MLVALLAVLGVDLIVIVVLLAGVIARRRWVRREPGAFPGAIRVASGELQSLGSKWKRGCGRWVRDVLVWTKAPLLVRNELVPADRLDRQRTGAPGEVKRLGDGPVVALTMGGRALRSPRVASTGTGSSAHIASPGLTGRHLKP